MWEEPSAVHFYSRLASFRRVVTFDKRGTGLSDPVMHAPTLEESVDDLAAIMDAAGHRLPTVSRHAEREGSGVSSKRMPQGRKRLGDSEYSELK